MDDLYNSLITMDPGKREFGLAHFFEGNLHDAVGLRAEPQDQWPIWLVAGKLAGNTAMNLAFAGVNHTTFAFEGMETRKGRRDAHAALMDLSRMSGAAVSRWPGSVKVVSPRAWTGTLSKRNHQRRTISALTVGEREVYDRAVARSPSSTKSEIVDAIGIGLYLLGRTR